MSPISLVSGCRRPELPQMEYPRKRTPGIGVRAVQGTIGVVFAALFWGSPVFSQQSPVEFDARAVTVKPSPYLPADHYREGFLTAGTYHERLVAVPELVGAFLSEGRVGELPGLFVRGAEKGEPWHEAAFGAEMYVVFGDLKGEYDSRRAMLESNPGNQVLLDRLWDLAAALEDGEGVRTFSQALAEKLNERIHWMDYYRVLVRRKEGQALLDTFEENGESLFSVRELFPELLRHESLDTISPLSVEAERSGKEDWRALFALGEYHLFSGEFDRALESFQNILRLEAGDSAGLPLNGFARLNRSHFSRYAAMRNIALITGEFRSDASLEFSFLGMPDRFEPGSLREARDAALLYWRYRFVEIGDPAEFLEQLEEILAEAGYSHGERILMMAIAGAPGYMMDEVERYLDSDRGDADTDQFILRAINRYLPSADRFPDIRGSMIDATNRISQRMADAEDSPGARQDVFRQRLNMLNRVNEPTDAAFLVRERLEELSERSDEDSIWERIGLALEIEDYPLAEEILEGLEGLRGTLDTQGEARRDGIRLYLASWYSGEGGNPERAEHHLTDYIRSLAERVERSDRNTFSVHSLWESDFLPAENPYWDRQQFLGIYEATEAFRYDGRFELLRNAVHTVSGEHGGSSLSALRFLESCLFWWRGDLIAARINLTEGALESNDPYLLFLAAFISARDQRVEQARAMLARIDEDAGDRFQRSALLFLIAADAADDNAMAEQAKALGTHEAPLDERISWALILVESGYDYEAYLLLSDLNPFELAGRHRDEYFESLLSSLRGMGELNIASSVARGLLQREMPPGFDGIDTSLRREALSVLREAGEISAYRLSLEDALELAHDSFQLTMLLAESLPYFMSDDDGSAQAELFEYAAEMRTSDFERQMGYAYWLDEKGMYSSSVDILDRLLDEDAPAVLVHDRRVINAYDMADALDRLIAFFENWSVPQARSIEDFYGLQPTSHLLEAIGTRMYERDEYGAAIEVWNKGIRLNPIGFTEPMRIKLASLLWREGLKGEYFAVIYDYLFRESARSELWVVHPFGSVVPRWLRMGRIREGGMDAPLLQMLAPLIDEPEGMEDLVRHAKVWRETAPKDFSSWAFYIVALALAGESDAESEWREIVESIGEARHGPDVLLVRQLEEWIRALGE